MSNLFVTILQEFFAQFVIFLWAIIELSINIRGEDVNAFGVQFSNQQETTIFDVTKFGAVGDGKRDDSQVISTIFNFINFFHFSYYCVSFFSFPLNID